MGTRHLTRVIVDGKCIISQYGQWDGYPTGQGHTIAKFLNGALERDVDTDFVHDAQGKMVRQDTVRDYIPDVQFNRARFLEGLKHIFEPTEAQIIESWKMFGHDIVASSVVSIDISKKRSRKFPSLSRDTGARILQLIQAATAENPLPIQNTFDAGSWLEWIWTLDFDTELLICGRGSNVHDRTETWSFMNPPTLEQLQALENQE